MEYQTETAEHTEQLARRIGQRLRGGEVIELTSDLGGGKTTFTRGLAAGMGSADHVASPTFTISREYNAGPLTMHHYDFYRLGNDAGIMADELRDVLDDPQAVTVVEWSEAVADVLPDDRLHVDLIRTGETSRQVLLKVPAHLAYLTEDVR